MDTAFTNSIGTIYTNRINFLDNFAANMTTLRDISVKELSRQALWSNEVFFIQSLIENPYLYGGGIRTFSGWYPALCYMNARAVHGGLVHRLRHLGRLGDRRSHRSPGALGE